MASVPRRHPPLLLAVRPSVRYSSEVFDDDYVIEPTRRR